MDVSRYQHEDSIVVDRPPDEVYALVTDVTRMGELSPVCTGGAWTPPATGPAPGAWFVGRNAIGEITWETRCEVVEVEPGRTFTFVNHGADGDRDLVRWGYRFEPEGDGTRVTETWQVLPAYPDFVRAGDPSVDDAGVATRIDGMAALARDGIRDTLAAVKRIAES